MLFVWILTLLNDIFSFSFRECLNKEHSISSSWIFMVAILNLICVLDIIRNFVTGYMDSYTKKSVLEPKKIALRYFRTWFLVDWIAIYVLGRMLAATFFVIRYNNTYKIGVLRYIRVARMATVIKNLRWITDYFGATFVQYLIMSIFIVACYIWHFNACIYVALPLLSTFHKGVQSNMSWIAHVMSSYEAESRTVTCLELYAHSLFECLIKMNLGMLNVYVPHEFDEVLFIIYCIITGFFFKALVFIFIYFIYDTTYHSTLKFIKISNHIQNYLYAVRSSEELHQKIKTYLHRRYGNEVYIETQKQLSLPLRLEIYTELWKTEAVNRSLLKTIPQRQLQKIFSSFELEIYLPNHVIYRVNQKAKHIYYLCSGSVAIYTESGVEMCHITDSSYFGLAAFVKRDSEPLRQHTAKTVETCEVLVLRYRDLYELSNKFPELKRFLESLIDDYYTGYGFFKNFRNFESDTDENTK